MVRETCLDMICEVFAVEVVVQRLNVEAKATSAVLSRFPFQRASRHPSGPTPATREMPKQETTRPLNRTSQRNPRNSRRIITGQHCSSAMRLSPRDPPPFLGPMNDSR